eukprot:4062578-Pleurochrysis_carterae.AAC.1
MVKPDPVFHGERDERKREAAQLYDFSMQAPPTSSPSPFDWHLLSCFLRRDLLPCAVICFRAACAAPRAPPPSCPSPCRRMQLASVVSRPDLAYVLTPP